MSKPNEITAMMLIVLMIASGIYDVVVVLLYGDEATVSAVLQNWSERFPLLSFVMGMIMGHLFWPRYIPRNKP